jgi:membrane fusion protein (multidrug efflux system)
MDSFDRNDRTRTYPNKGQRLAVWIALDPQELEKHPLHIGLSTQADVSTKDQSGGQLGEAPNRAYQTNVFAKYGDEADAEIARIVSKNAGTGGGQHNGAAQKIGRDAEFGRKSQ